MAATKKGVKSRLDFGAALNEALFVEKNEIHEEESIKKTTEMKPESVLNEQIEVKAVEEQPSEEVQIIKNQGIEESQKPKMVSQKKKVVKKEEEIKTTISNEAEKFKALASKRQGATKSVYFERDVLDFLMSKSEQYNVKFSKVVNLLIKECMMEE